MTGNSHPHILEASAAGIVHAANKLRNGGLVALPTETVYGLAARADSDAAVAAIYRAKGRPDFNPLIVHVTDLTEAERLALFDDRARALAAAFWPGSLTMVLPKRPEARLAAAVTAGLSTVALRCPAHPVMRAVLAETGLPLAAPSANRSGGVSPTCADHVAAALGAGVEMILDGGACAAGVESTIVAVDRGGGWRMLRPGPITKAQLVDVLGPATRDHASGAIEAPGQLASHYSPGKPVRLDAITGSADEFHIGFGTVGGDFNLSASGDLAEAASQLYSALHAAAEAASPRVAVAPVPTDGIGLAINDRLKRAAA
jgi:L-threonylcarbamoyladenylate synthase